LYLPISAALKDSGSEFLSNYIRLAEGEKDPRNLMLAFAIDRVIGVEFDISAHAEVSDDIVCVTDGHS
jgi:DNA repair/transcription protein MET18/MMS19